MCIYTYIYVIRAINWEHHRNNPNNPSNILRGSYQRQIIKFSYQVEANTIIIEDMKYAGLDSIGTLSDQTTL